MGVSSSSPLSQPPIPTPPVDPLKGVTQIFTSAVPTAPSNLTDNLNIINQLEKTTSNVANLGDKLGQTNSLVGSLSNDIRSVKSDLTDNISSGFSTLSTNQMQMFSGLNNSISNITTGQMQILTGVNSSINGVADRFDNQLASFQNNLNSQASFLQNGINSQVGLLQNGINSQAGLLQNGLTSGLSNLSSTINSGVNGLASQNILMQQNLLSGLDRALDSVDNLGARLDARTAGLEQGLANVGNGLNGQVSGINNMIILAAIGVGGAIVLMNQDARRS